MDRWWILAYCVDALSASRSESGWKAEVSELLRSIQLVAKEGECTLLRPAPGDS